MEWSGTYRDGKIELDVRVDWKDGTRVVVSLEDTEHPPIREGDYPDTPEGNAAYIAKMQSFPELPPPTPEEAEEFMRSLAEVRRFFRPSGDTGGPAPNSNGPSHPSPSPSKAPDGGDAHS